MLQELTRYLDSVVARDPSPRSRWEVLMYPGVWALGLHRVAHWLFEAELFLLARMVNTFSRFMTAIDIHPGAKIGRNFFIDHGFVVIGETAEIGDDVTMYQGSTLGGTNPTNGVSPPPAWLCSVKSRTSSARSRAPPAASAALRVATVGP